MTATSVELRDELQQLVLDDLLGPAGGPEEIVDERTVRDRYLVGLLAPRGRHLDPEAYDDDAPLLGDDGEEGRTEAPPPKAATMLPSSFGLTFTVCADCQALRITARWGRYERTTTDDERYRREDGKPRRVWQRLPMEGVVEARLDEGPLWNAGLAPVADQPDVYVRGICRRVDGQWVITLFLVNGQREPKKGRDKAWVFQPELVVEAPDGAPVFERRPLPLDTDDPERLTLAMLYRGHIEFAVGHSVSVHAEVADGQPPRAVRLRTTVVPRYDVPQTTPPTDDEIPALAQVTLDMQALSETPNGEFGRSLGALADSYAAWIQEQAARIDTQADLAPFKDAAAPAALDTCRDTLRRIRAGIALLDRDSQAADAFRFANRAMYLQRQRTLYAREVRQGKTPDMSVLTQRGTHRWRAFQLAFILLNLVGLTDLASPDRSEIADLLWFPTGGGKTEAYLGLAAYTMGLRRLQGVVGGRSGHAGVAVLMRYTLRLLTLQQFQRAATLICACEMLRREDPGVWGSEPFRIGLWVGAKSTPNWTKDAAEAVGELRRNSPPGGGTPHQLTNCPWCGRDLDGGRDIQVETYERGRGRTLLYCSDPLGECPFSPRHADGEGIPAVLVDEEIYRRLPSLLIATVDKFARMPWEGRTAMLFGQVDGYCERHGYRSPEVQDSDSHPAKNGLPKARTLPVAPLRPPDLIIQDELHLISGPLGTLVGLYETAVDHLASWEVNGKRVSPKIVASTATIRRADLQVHNVFNRRVVIFPPAGLDVGDNFFSRQRQPTDDTPGRCYLGVCAFGARHKTALIRVYVALLSAAQQLYDKYGADADPWLTLVGYFNSLRELGSMRRAAEDAITTRLRRMRKRGQTDRFLAQEGIQELTSRQSAIDIPDILDRLELSFSPEAAHPPARAGKGKAAKRPIDILLATNMISVGVDVGRLGLMVVGGQPKTTAEYIQATSRVGRAHPGLIVTVYNWARPRDLSHYEQFEHYHRTFYQHVEALSVTPFSPRALDRGLTAVLMALVRLRGMDLNPNMAAALMKRDHPLVREAVATILRRADLGRGDTRALVQAMLEERLDLWGKTILQTSGAQLGYAPAKDGKTVGLLKMPELGPLEKFTCLNSLRDVEPSVNLILRDAGADWDEAHPWRYGDQDEEPDEDEVGSEEGDEA